MGPMRASRVGSGGVFRERLDTVASDLLDAGILGGHDGDSVPA